MKVCRIKNCRNVGNITDGLCIKHYREIIGHAVDTYKTKYQVLYQEKVSIEKALNDFEMRVGKDRANRKDLEGMIRNQAIKIEKLRYKIQTLKDVHIYIIDRIGDDRS